MALSLETTVSPWGRPRVRLLDADAEAVRERELGVRELVDEDDFAAWDCARVVLGLHTEAVMLEQAAKLPGVLPLPPDHVPAEEYFMVAVRLLFPGYAVADPTPSPSPARS